MKRSLPLALVVAALLFVSGCDAVVEGNRVVLQPRDLTLRFELSNLAQDIGGTVQSIGTVSFAGNLDGFQLADVVSARVTEARISRISPIGSGNGVQELLRDAQITLVGGGSVIVANLAAGTSTATVQTMSVTRSEVASITQSPSFIGRMQYTPRANRTSAVFEVTLTFVLEVEGP